MSGWRPLRRLSLRYRLAEALGNFADWLKYPPLITCQRPGCGYVEGGVHDPADECLRCTTGQADPSEHHAFVPPSRWRRLIGRSS
jgi:hypothetical protein